MQKNMKEHMAEPEVKSMIESGADLSAAFVVEDLSFDELLRFQRPIPRYTSYPTAPMWGPLSQEVYEEKLRSRNRHEPISIYIHAPFCSSMCLFCGCHVILNRRIEQRREYAALVEREMALVFDKIGPARITQIHLGGGTPTYMPLECLENWINACATLGNLDKDAEISIEIDPRTLQEPGIAMLKHLRAMGFNRVSFGVQDTSKRVQEAIKRRQSADISEQTLIWAKEVGFKGINIDLIYGLPLQTEDSFLDTVERVIQWRPDRVAMYSYANVPWIKPHQKAIDGKNLPSHDVKLKLYLQARRQFLQAGYVAIGMDHFAAPHDEMAAAYKSGGLQRNFQGYSMKLADDLIGFGVSSTGFVEDLYTQNIKEIESYRLAITAGKLPVFRGLSLSSDDKRRRFVIQSLMCNFRVDYQKYTQIFGCSFSEDFEEELSLCRTLEEDGLLTCHPDAIIATPKGAIFIRLLASIFDAYLKAESTDTIPSQGRFSMSI